MISKSVSILGCGWLGLPVAKTLVSLGCQVKGSTTTIEKLPELKNSGIESFLISVQAHNHIPIDSKFFESSVLLIDIPFRRSLENPFDYFEQIKNIVEDIKTTPIQKVIFTSSTSIYPDSIVDSHEDVNFEPVNDRSSALLSVEKMLLNLEGLNCVILRLSGLYGGNRKIGQFMAGKCNVPNGNQPVNLVHLDDCIKIMTQIIFDDDISGIFNVCSDAHPKREELYIKAAKCQKVSPPAFSKDERQEYKIVNNYKIKKELNYTFIHPDPMLDL